MLFNIILLSVYTFLFILACLYLAFEILEYIKLEKAYQEERKRYYNFKKMYSKFY